MMKHKKLKHIEEVRECSKFKEGECGFSDQYCWNIHTKNNHMEEHDREISKEQDFHKIIDKAVPPESGH